VVVDGTAHPDLLLNGWRLFTAVVRAVRRDFSSTVRSSSCEVAAVGEERAPMNHWVEATVRMDHRVKP
jgi:hypothetical protein